MLSINSLTNVMCANILPNASIHLQNMYLLLACIVRCGENTENEFGIPVFVGKTVYIYTKTSPFVEIWKQILLPMRKWLQKFCRPT